MKSLVLHLTKCIPDSMVASVRIANYLSSKLGVPLIDSPNEELANQEYDAVFLVNSPTGFAPAEMRWQVAEILHNTKFPIFVQNDYKMAPPSQVQRVSDRLGIGKLLLSYWTTVPERMRGGPVDTYINWNRLGYTARQGITKGLLLQEQKKGVVYWGALRKGREERLAQFLDTEAFPVTISTASQSIEKFRNYAPFAKFVGKFNHLTSDIAGYDATVYVEDQWSNKHYCSPACRFYEAVRAGLLVLVDERAAHTFTEAGLPDVESFTISNDADIAEKLKSKENLLVHQQYLWRADYLDLLDKQIEAAWKLLQDRCKAGS